VLKTGVLAWVSVRKGTRASYVRVNFLSGCGGEKMKAVKMKGERYLGSFRLANCASVANKIRVLQDEKRVIPLI
jgi:hypothetical protein